MPLNLNLPGLVWLGLALSVCLTAVAVRRLPDSPADVRSRHALVSCRDAYRQGEPIHPRMAARESARVAVLTRGPAAAADLCVDLARRLNMRAA